MQVSDRTGFSRYLGLAGSLAVREFLGAYRGNLTGALAAIAVPLAMLATYSFVFSTLIPVRISTDQSRGDYTLFLFSGLVVWNLFADVVVRSPRLFVSGANYVHRPHFPVSILVLAPCLASFYRSLPWMVVYLVAQIVIAGTSSWIVFAAPLVLAAATVLTVGVSLSLAALGAALRDISDVVPPAVTLLFFLSPILYPAAKLDEVGEWILILNPAATMIEVMRVVLFEHDVPSSLAIIRFLGTAFGWLGVGTLFYRAVRHALPDLI
jgi:lipopolysaccharide transport system permease protein